MTLEWGDPPSARRKGKWAPVFAGLEDRPGDWAKLSENTTRNAYSLAGRLRKLGEGEFEFTSRAYGDGNAGVWGRYIGHLAKLEAEIAEVEIGSDHDGMKPEELPNPL